MKLVAVVVVAAALLLGPRVALAGGEASQVALDYDAPAGCVAADDFAALVRSHSSLLTFGNGAEEILATVRVEKTGDAFHGSLVLRMHNANTSRRVLSAETCGVVTDGLALVLALALDPDATLAPEESAEPAPAASASRSATPASRRDTSAMSPIATEPPPHHVGVGISFGLDTAIAPVSLGRGALFFEYDAARPGASVWSPSLRVAVVRSLTAHSNEPAGAAAFTVTAASLDVCPLRLGSGAVSAAPCVQTVAGLLDASGEGGRRTEAHSRFSMTASVFGRVRIAPYSRVFLGIDAGASLPLVRDRFYFGPTPSAPISAPPVGFIASLGAGVHFL